MRLAGIDLAWQPSRHGSAVAVGVLQRGTLRVSALHSGVIGLDAVQTILGGCAGLQGVAIDASLIVNNAAGQRGCEHDLGSDYARYHAGCHPTNLGLYPEPAGVALARWLMARGFRHLGKPSAERFQIECYPHPAMVEMFGLPRRLSYKKGPVADRRAGQQGLARWLRELAHSTLLVLEGGDLLETLLDEPRIARLRGARLKENEDALDAIVCLYIAGLYARGVAHRVYGDSANGYIYVPRARAVTVHGESP